MANGQIPLGGFKTITAEDLDADGNTLTPGLPKTWSSPSEGSKLHLVRSTDTQSCKVYGDDLGANNAITATLVQDSSKHGSMLVDVYEPVARIVLTID